MSVGRLKSDRSIFDGIPTNVSKVYIVISSTK